MMLSSALLDIFSTHCCLSILSLSFLCPLHHGPAPTLAIQGLPGQQQKGEQAGLEEVKP